jgi:O-antigen ligase
MSITPQKFAPVSITQNAPQNMPGRAGSRGRGWIVFGFVVLAGLGALGFLYPDAAFALTVLGVIGALTWWGVQRLRRAGMQVWQVLLLVTLSCYMILNYGFENIAVHAGPVPLIVSYAMMYTCFAMAVYANRKRLGSALQEPAMLCILGLLLLSAIHLIANIPEYGIWAIRDSTIFLDGIFFLLGLFWAVQDRDLKVMVRWMMILFFVNMIYAYTYPWSEQILAASPSSGVFMEIPIFGQYHQTAMDLLVGAAFCMGLARFVVKRRTWILHIMIAVQLLGLAILQSRATYIALALYIVIFFVLRETRKATALLALASFAVAGLVALTTLGGLEITGRIGPVNLNFLQDHLRSINGGTGTAASSVDSRFEFADDVSKHIKAHPVFGEGFGQPLIDYIDDETGAVVRVPHNSHLTVTARLGFVGLAVWIGFNGCLLALFVYAFRHRKFWDRLISEFVLWSFLYYVVFMIESLVEGPLETPATAIPFYFLTGLLAGVVRLRMTADQKLAAAVDRPVAELKNWSATHLGVSQS